MRRFVRSLLYSCTTWIGQSRETQHIFPMSAAIVLLSQPQQVFGFDVVIHLTVIKQFCKTGVIIINGLVVQGWIRMVSYEPDNIHHFSKNTFAVAAVTSASCQRFQNILQGIVRIVDLKVFIHLLYLCLNHVHDALLSSHAMLRSLQ